MWSNYGKTFISILLIFNKNKSHVTILGLDNLVSKGEKNLLYLFQVISNFELMSMEITKKIFL